MVLRRRPALSTRCVVLGGSRSLRAVLGAFASSLGAVAVVRRSRRRCLRRRAGAPGAGLIVPPRSRRRDAPPSLLRGGGSRSLRRVPSSVARPLCEWPSARSHSLWVRSPLRRPRGAAACGAALALLVSRGRAAHSRRRGARPRSFAAAAHALGVVMLVSSARPFARGCRSSARSLPLWGRWLSRGARDAAAYGAALALLALAWSCRRAHDGVALGRCAAAAAARSFGTHYHERHSGNALSTTPATDPPTYGHLHVHVKSSVKTVKTPARGTFAQRATIRVWGRARC